MMVDESNDLFGQDIREKMKKLFQILRRINSVEYLSKRLSFYGGTALHSIHFNLAHRLSVDLDFNYRKINDNDWGDEREAIDSRIKSVLDSLGYSDYRIQPTYPLNRFDIKFRSSSGSMDSIKIEIGYLRRVPFSKDVYYSIENEYCTKFNCLSPMKEELFANKIVTFLSRRSARDLFDVHSISKAHFNIVSIRKLVLLESVAILDRPLTELELPSLINDVRIDGSLTSLIRSASTPDHMKSDVSVFLQGLMSEFTAQESKFLDEFYQSGQFLPNMLDFKSLNSQASTHPSVLWNLRKLGYA
jgi:predicted nucleotidyltransferase component of viral defense system